jgi:hypothetical protein
LYDTVTRYRQSQVIQSGATGGNSWLLDSAWEAAEENGEIPHELQQALLNYCEAFGEKVDYIARYIHAQEAVVTIP